MYLHINHHFFNLGSISNQFLEGGGYTYTRAFLLFVTSFFTSSHMSRFCLSRVCRSEVRGHPYADIIDCRARYGGHQFWPSVMQEFDKLNNEACSMHASKALAPCLAQGGQSTHFFFDRRTLSQHTTYTVGCFAHDARMHSGLSSRVMDGTSAKRLSLYLKLSTNIISNVMQRFYKCVARSTTRSMHFLNTRFLLYIQK